MASRNDTSTINFKKKQKKKVTTMKMILTHTHIRQVYIILSYITDSTNR